MTSSLPFVAYKGDEAFIFISYAHKDSERVFPIIKQMHEAGFRIWYDEGIDPGSEWPEEIAKHINGASAVLLFVSPQSMDSHNVRREVTFAINLRTHMVSVYLEPTEMSAGMSLQLGLNQAVHYYTYRTDKEFFDKLLPALPEKTKGSMRAVPYASQQLQSYPATQAAAQPQSTLQPLQQPPGQPIAQPSGYKVPDKLAPQMPLPATATMATGPNLDFDPRGIVLPFMQKGVARLYLKNGGETACPLNCFVVPRPNGNYDCLCLNKSLKGDEQYYIGARGESYRFEDTSSIEVSESGGKLNLLIYLANGERRFFDGISSFEVGGLFGRSFRRYSISEIAKIVFEPHGVLDETPDLALVTTKSGLSFYTPVAMLDTVQFAVAIGGAGHTRESGFRLEDILLEYRKLATMEIDLKQAGSYMSDDDISVRYTMRSGASDAVQFKRHYTPSLSGINQYGCFNLSFAQISRIDVFAGNREGAPTPTPLPDIIWPQPETPVTPFYPDGLAVITNAAGTMYKCPANTVFGVDGYEVTNVYDKIRTSIGGEKFYEFFSGSGLNSFEDIESIELDYIRDFGSSYNVNIRDSAGVTLKGVFSHAESNAPPALAFAYGGEKGAVRFLSLKSLKFDRYEDAPGVEQAVVYTKNGKAIGMPRGSVIFSSGGSNSYPGCCFSLPTGNAVDTSRLRRMMIFDQQAEGGMQRWIVFECDDLRGAFPLVPELWKEYRLFGASAFGLCQLKAGDEWYLLDMKK